MWEPLSFWSMHRKSNQLRAGIGLWLVTAPNSSVGHLFGLLTNTLWFIIPLPPRREWFYSLSHVWLCGCVHMRELCACLCVHVCLPYVAMFVYRMCMSSTSDQTAASHTCGVGRLHREHRWPHWNVVARLVRSLSFRNRDYHPWSALPCIHM